MGDIRRIRATRQSNYRGVRRDGASGVHYTKGIPDAKEKNQARASQFLRIVSAIYSGAGHGRRRASRTNATESR